MIRWWMMMAGAVAGGAGVAMPRVEVPITAVILSDGARRYTIPVTVGGVALTAGLDTGSTGLRFLARAVPQAAAARGQRTNYAYSSGLSIGGAVVTQPLAIGAATGDVPVQRIDTIGCLARQPDCPSNRLAAADYGLQGDGLKGEGFAAIIGIDMAANEAPNPLVALGASRWIVELPRPGEPGPGRLIVDPTDGEVAGYVRVGLLRGMAAARGGVHDAVAGCLIRTDTDARVCGPLIFDSGAPGLRVSLPGFVPWPQGTPGRLVIGDGDARQGIAFVAGRREQASGMFVERIGPNGVPHISAGLMPYFGWSVLYDAKAGAIGLRPRG